MKFLSRLIPIMRISVVCFLLMGSSIAYPYFDIEDRIEKTFDVGEGGNLVVETDLGSIEVETHNSKTVKVILLRKFDAWNQEDVDEILKDFKIDFDSRDSDVYIRAKYRRYKNNFWGWDRQRLQLRYIITVPQKYNVDLETSGGSISVDDLEGEVRSSTSGGSLNFGRITGPVWGETSGGSIDLKGCIGKADVNTSGGSIRIGQVDGDVFANTSGGSIHIAKSKGRVDAHTSGGYIEVEEVMGAVDAETSGGSVTAYITKQPDKDCHLETSGGSVTVYLIDGIAVDVDARSSGGRVRNDFPITGERDLTKSRLRGRLNGGGPLLYLRSSGGGVNIREM